MNLEMIERNFGRIVSPIDERDYALARFIIEPLLDIRKILFGERKVWDCDVVLDQGNSNHCVGFACAGWGNALPLDSEQTNDSANEIYYAAKTFDANPEGEDGTTIRSGAKALKQLGRLQAYAFTRQVNEVATWLHNHGTVIVGTDWFQGMMQPDTDGFVHPTGQLLGGHAWLILGYDFTNPLRRYFIGLNSWGESWGKQGRFNVLVDDVARWLASGGEAVTAVEVAKT